MCEAEHERFSHRFLTGDVTLTKDNKVVVIHDDTVDRVLEGRGQVSKLVPAQSARTYALSRLTLAEIQAMPFKRVGEVDVPHPTPNWNTLGQRLDRVPTLEQLIIFCKVKGLRLMIEIKGSHSPLFLVGSIAGLLKAYEMTTQACAQRTIAVRTHSHFGCRCRLVQSGSSALPRQSIGPLEHSCLLAVLPRPQPMVYRSAFCSDSTIFLQVLRREVGRNATHLHQLPTSPLACGARISASCQTENRLVCRTSFCSTAGRI